MKTRLLKLKIRMIVHMKAGNKFEKFPIDQQRFLQEMMTLAVGVLNGIRDDGFSVPEDYELICFEHSNLARIVRPQLTSVVVPLYDFGAVAMRLLTKLMNDEEVEEKKLFFRLDLKNENQ